jgi:Transcriptional regulator, AbiEi antitoxin, Type IV TA system/Transcriptional regulator, AbiEi antitoxin N-terminal domain
MNANRIKSLQTTVSRGAPIDTATLSGLGISAALAHEYVKSGWLEKLGRGVFMFTEDKLQRSETLAFLESKMPGIHIAAKTALAWHGYRHNVAVTETSILWGDHRNELPSWFQNRFPARYSSSNLFDAELPAGTGIARMPEFPNGPLVSSPERALLEMLSEVGVSQELEEARAIMETVRQLRSRQLSLLLSHCRMVKAVRLCVVWARELELPWAEQAREAAKDRMGSGRWITRLKNGNTLILKPE